MTEEKQSRFQTEGPHELFTPLWRRRDGTFTVELVGMELAGGVVLSKTIMSDYYSDFAMTNSMIFVPGARIVEDKFAGEDDWVQHVLATERNDDDRENTPQ